MGFHNEVKFSSVRLGLPAQLRKKSQIRNVNSGGDMNFKFQSFIIEKPAYCVEYWRVPGYYS